MCFITKHLGRDSNFTVWNGIGKARVLCDHPNYMPNSVRGILAGSMIIILFNNRQSIIIIKKVHARTQRVLS